MSEIDIAAPGGSAAALAAALAEALNQTQEITSSGTPTNLDPEVRLFSVTTGGTAGDEVLNLPPFAVDEGSDYNGLKLLRTVVVTLTSQVDGADRLIVTAGGSGSIPLFASGPADTYSGIAEPGVILDFPGATVAFIWTGYGWEVWQGLAGYNDDSERVPNTINITAPEAHGADNGVGAALHAGSTNSGDGAGQAGGVNVSAGSQQNPANDNPGGAAHLIGGVAAGGGDGGQVSVQGGANSSGAGGKGGDAVVVAGAATGAGSVGGDASVTAGDGEAAGDLSMLAGNGVASGGDVHMAAGSASDGAGVGGSAFVLAGSVADGGTPGSVTLQPGSTQDDTTHGHIFVHKLPAADPHIVDALYVSAGVIKISAG